MEESAIRVYHHYLSSAKHTSVEMLHPVHVFFFMLSVQDLFFALLFSINLQLFVEDDLEEGVMSCCMFKSGKL